MNYKNKIFKESEGSFQEIIEKWKKLNKRIVFTNGCFDLLHSGHVKYLNEAAKMGDKLIIGLNSDSSVRKIKGKNRPVKSQQCRAEILAFMKVVDMVIIFNDETRLNLIENIVPDILVKGGDWDKKNIVGADIVLKNGGEVKSLTFLKGFSSSKIIDKIKNG